MSKITEKELKAYFKAVSEGLVTDKKKKGAFLKELEAEVEDYLSSREDVTMSEIEASFGTPEQIAQSFLSQSDPVKIRKSLSIKKVLLLALAIILLVYVVFVIVSLIDVHTEAHGFFTEGLLMLCLRGGIL